MPTALPARRRSPIARFGRSVGFIALGAAIGYAAALGAPDRLVGSLGAVIQEASQSARATPTLAGFATVVDGDTLRIRGERIRIEGIDAPELRQTCRDAQGRDWSCGRTARQQMTLLIGSREVACTSRGRDRYGRVLATCAAGGIADLGAALVRAGYAVSYRRYSSAYVADEDLARAARQGLWQGEFENPEDWRRRRRH